MRRPDEVPIERLSIQLLRLLDTIQYRNGEQFTFNGTNYLLVVCTAEDIANSRDAQAVESICSTQITGWDIYVLDSLTAELRTRMLFQQVLECNLRDKGRSPEAARALSKTEEARLFDKLH